MNDDWRKKVDETLVSLTSAQRSIDSQIEDLSAEIADVKRILDGFEDKAGVLERMHDVERMANQLRAITLPDVTGKGGFAWRLDRLEDNREERTKTMGERLKFWGVLVGAAVLLIRELVHDIPMFETLWNRPAPTETIQSNIVKSVEPIHHRHHTKKKQEETSTPDTMTEEMPMMMDGPQ